MTEFEVEITTGILKGTVVLPDVGSVDPPPPPPGNGDPSPPAAEPYHWFQNGVDLSILVGDQKLNEKLITAQAVYRSGIFSGFILLDKSSPQAGESIRVIPRGDHIPFQTPGLANIAGATYGTGWYANKSQKDGMPCRVEWEGYGLKFRVPDPGNSGRMASVKKGYPSDWGGY